MKKKEKKGGPWTTKMKDGSFCTLQHWTDGTSTLDVTKLNQIGKKVVPLTETHEWTTPQREEKIEDYQLSIQSGKIMAVRK
jgi:hypothetical protein